MNRPTPAHLAALAAAVLLLGTACAAGEDPTASSPAPPDESASAGDDHGEIEGAAEVAEPPLHLLTVAGTGAVGLVDLVDGTATDVGAVGPPASLTTDGRYAFVATPAGLEVVDSGLWTWDHGDHFHYYRADAALLGTVPGSGAPTVTPGALSTAGGTGVLFASGEAVLLDNQALSEGRLDEVFRTRVEPHDGLVVPVGDGAVVSVPGADGRVASVARYGADGVPVAGSEQRCVAPRGTITTAAGTVVGCADGVLLWAEESGDGTWDVERIPYPPGTDAPRATSFGAREGRPTVAALAGPDRVWLLDTRERTWDLLDVGVPLRQVSAADDEDGHVVALDRAGRVRVYLAATGRQVGVTEPLLGPGAVARGVRLVVDDQRAYLNDPGGQRVLEIDYADGARVAREIATPAGAAFFAEVGR